MCDKSDIVRLSSIVKDEGEKQIIAKSIETFGEYLKSKHDREHYLQCVRFMRKINEISSKNGMGVLHQINIGVALDEVLCKIVN